MKQEAIIVAFLLLATALMGAPGINAASSPAAVNDGACTASCDSVLHGAATANNETWSIEMVDSVGKTGQHTDIACSPDGTIFISYYDFLQEDLRCAYKHGETWEVDTVDAEGVVGTYTSIDVDSDGAAAISYYDETNLDLKYATRQNGRWTTETVDTGGDVGRYSALALDGQDNPHIVYYDASGRNLKYATRSAGSWTVETVSSEGDAGRYAAIALDSQGMPHCTFGRDDTVLMYAHRTAAGWETMEIVSETKLFESTAIDIEDDTVHVSYFDVSDDPTWWLRYAVMDDGEWTIEVVDPYIYGFWNERGLDMAVRDGVVHIGYFHWDDWDTGYAYRYRNTWTTEIVESNGDIGAFASIALDSQGYPHMSYMDRSNLALKYAYKTKYAPVAPDKPDGPGRGRTGAEYTYSTSAGDLDGDEVQYGWDWDGDRAVDDWTSFTSPGTEIETSHTYESDGTYSVRVKARDETGLESDWSEPLQVAMPRHRDAPASLWHWLMEHLSFFFPLFSSIQ